MSNKNQGDPSGLDTFQPYLRNLQGNTWEAGMRLPAVGDVRTTGNGWQEAKLRLWIISEAVKLLQSQNQKDPRDWTDDEWRSTLQAMKRAMSPNKPL